MEYFALKLSGKWSSNDFLADLLFFQHIQVNRLDFNAWKCLQTYHYIELSEYKLYMGHIHTLVFFCHATLPHVVDIAYLWF